MAICCVICGEALARREIHIPQPLASMCGITSRTVVSEDKRWMEPCILVGTPEFLEWKQKDGKEKAEMMTKKGSAMDFDLLRLIPAFRLQHSDGIFYETVEEGGVRSLRFHPMQTNGQFPMPIPLHLDCLKVAMKFKAYQKRFDLVFRSDRGEPTHLTHLYEVWCQRAAYTAAYTTSDGILRVRVGEPRNYLRTYANTNMRYVSPFKIPDLTAKIVAYLQKMPENYDWNDYPEKVEFRSRWEKLAPELQDILCLALQPFRNAPLRGTRFHLSTWWRDQLLGGFIIPWLWDLNKDELEKSHPALFDPETEQDWDWERLVRELSRNKAFTAQGLLGSLEIKQKNGLMNRRRLWKLLRNTRLGHLPVTVSAQPSP
ncbi:uncharacterized protein BCR38DRAFT_125512 [Pseudomassariella vexata]|uniref:Uncharacterized protein n=1 Tax=Pseudomassariella vexata TaxID=1141098 RepID=A0A1Y2D8L5_9PEZI|nr:uncharacterized protein BCR38DRAFT_125512 [Pseudomassariella vexata]ORY55514.1 hypothetical protein BCR38DRAFT_125512 [Pseudomassariella vexata]